LNIFLPPLKRNDGKDYSGLPYSQFLLAGYSKNVRVGWKKSMGNARGKARGQLPLRIFALAPTFP